MKRRFLSFFLLVIFSLSNAGVVLGLHTCLKSQKTDFSVFPTQNQACCSGLGLENENKEPICQFSIEEAYSLNFKESPIDCCLNEQSGEGCTSSFLSTKNEPSDRRIRADKFDCCGVGIENEACSGEDCCRVEQVVLLDLHPRSIPKTMLDFGFGILLPITHSIFRGFSWSTSEIKGISILETHLGKSFTDSEVLQVWRL
jgi:hypothetical protein